MSGYDDEGLFDEGEEEDTSEICRGCGCIFDESELCDGLCDGCEDDSDDEDDEDEELDFEDDDEEEDTAGQCVECNGPCEKGAGDVCEECLDGAGGKE